MSETLGPVVIAVAVAAWFGFGVWLVRRMNEAAMRRSDEKAREMAKIGVPRAFEIRFQASRTIDTTWPWPLCECQKRKEGGS